MYARGELWEIGPAVVIEHDQLAIEGQTSPAVMHHGIGFSSPLSTPVTRLLPNPRDPIFIARVGVRA
jgi:hypothetical protein